MGEPTMSVFFDRTRQPIPGLFVLLALASSSTALAALPFDLPPVSNPASTEHHPGKAIWADLVTPDLGAAERFYGGLFGWTFQTIPGGDTQYAVYVATYGGWGRGYNVAPARGGDHNDHDDHGDHGNHGGHGGPPSIPNRSPGHH